MPFGAATPKAVIDQVAANDPGLTALNLAGNALFQMKAHEYCGLLAQALKSNTNVTDVNLTNCGITDADVALLAESLPVNSTITNLTLEGNRIQAEGAIAIAKGLAQNTSIRTINLLNQPGSFGVIKPRAAAASRGGQAALPPSVPSLREPAACSSIHSIAGCY